jgi:hypothetical protein
MSVTLNAWQADIALLAFLAMAVMIGFYANREQTPDPRWFGLAFLVIAVVYATAYFTGGAAPDALLHSK